MLRTWPGSKVRGRYFDTFRAIRGPAHNLLVNAVTQDQTKKQGAIDAADWADPSVLPVEEVRDVFLSDAKGVPLAKPEVVTLDEVDPASGLPKRTVIKTTDPARYDIWVADYVTT